MNWKLFLIVCTLGISQKVFSQTNVYPNSGKVVIDALDVNGKLMAKGTGSLNNNPGVADLQIGLGIGPPGAPGSIARLALQPYGHTGGPWLFVSRDDAAGAALDFNYGFGNIFTMNHLGNIGVGTQTPKEKLSVNGKIRAQGIKVEIQNWPDFVFAKAYHLPGLLEIENHIAEKGHLPGIPSAEEVKVNGVDLGEMDAKLLQKIEELTLYLIKITKQLEAQEVLNAKYLEEINMLKASGSSFKK